MISRCFMKKYLLAFLSVIICNLAVNASIKGDVNGDGIVSSVDVAAIYNYLLNDDDTYLSTSDINGDGIVSSVDITIIYNILLGIVTHDYVDLGLPSGTLWATMNIGAINPQEFGDYFAWGETNPKDVYNWNTYKWCKGAYNMLTKYCKNGSYGYNGFVDNKTELDPEDDAATANWGSNWRIPTKDQQDELRAECSWKWTNMNGVKGYLVTSKHNGASLFLPATGWRSDSELYRRGIWGEYWSRILHETNSSGAYYLYFADDNTVNYSHFYRYRGRCVRAVRVF